MRNFTLVSALIILLVLPGMATAVTLDALSGTADCNSWSADLTIAFRSNAMMARVEYAVVLQDADGAEVERFDFSDFIEIPDTPSATYNYTGGWSSSLDGLYTVTAEFNVFDVFGDGFNLSSGSFAVDLACGSAGDDDDSDPILGEACLYRSKHWADHPELWPVASLNIGGQTMSQDELLNILERRRNSLLMFALTRELVAAKLNLANGGSPKAMSVVADADAFLANRQATRRGAHNSHGQAMKLKVALAKYNRGGCPDGRMSGISMSLGDDSDQSFEKAAIEVVNLGTIKAMYR